MKILTKEQVLFLHSELIKCSGGQDGLRDENLLDSALSSPFQIFDGLEVFSSLQQKAARLGFGLIKNHAFIDGNKRIGAHCMLVFLSLNGIELEYTQKELYTIIIDIASGNQSFEDLLKWIIEHQV